jgi:Uncharacterized protein conserved in bacteria (DUF2262).
MTHNILGIVKRLNGDPFDGIATIRHGSRDIKVGITCDDQTFETSLNLAALVVQRLEDLDKVAKQIAATDLCATYNNGWNEYDEVQDDDSLKTVTNPQLSMAEFEAKLSLNAVNVLGDRMIDFFYADDGMFWGHSIVVKSMNGVDLTGAWAELFG